MAGLKPLPSQTQQAQQHHRQQQQQQQLQQQRQQLGSPTQPGSSPPSHRPTPTMSADNAHPARSSQSRKEPREKNRIAGEHGTHTLGGGSGDHRSNGQGPLSVRAGPQAQLASNGHSRQPPGPGMPAFDGPRSPPTGKNTSHVPCKFFRQGACQAGKACPFSHALDPASTQAPCKYFAKGNCKFGAKCALAHVLPDGRRVNRPNVGVPAPNLNLGGRVNPEPYHNPPSALANSLLQAHVVPAPFGHQYPLPPPDEYLPLPTMPMGNLDAVPGMDPGFFSSRPDSNYGSPREDVRFPLSPAIKGLSTLDAPLPASFDSNGISWIARNGPVAASVPSKFGLESPPHSFKEVPPSEALRTLHDSAFGNGDRGNLTNGLASSPPPSTGESAAHRILHSQRFNKPKVMSASLPRAVVNDDWDSTFAFEEDFIPNSLHELLTPQEKMRRFSRSGGEEDALNTRLSLSGFGTPGEPSSKVGSPTASSPSRFGPLFSRQKREEDHAYPVSGFGHVGSPLRNSMLNPGSSPGPRAIGRSTSGGDISPYFASPPRQSSMSMISQQLQRTRLSKTDHPSGDGGLHPASAKQPLNPSGKILDRVMSTSSMSNGRIVSSIDEEPGEVFSMEEEERYGDGWSYPVGGRSPGLAPIGDGRITTTGSESKEEKGLLGLTLPRSIT